MKRLVLASSSPRRKELLEQTLLSFEVIPSEIEEVMDENLPPNELVCKLAEQKASDVFNKNQNSVVIGADTIVVCGNKRLGKPKNQEDAESMLSLLSGRKHEVYTGVCIMDENQKQTFSVCTEVSFWPLTKEQISWYIKSGEPFDKAGSYGIQGVGSIFIQSITGDYYSVVGLPISLLAKKLKEFGIVYSNVSH